MSRRSTAIITSVIFSFVFFAFVFPAAEAGEKYDPYLSVGVSNTKFWYLDCYLCESYYINKKPKDSKNKKALSFKVGVRKKDSRFKYFDPAVEVSYLYMFSQRFDYGYDTFETYNSNVIGVSFIGYLDELTKGLEPYVGIGWRKYKVDITYEYYDDAKETIKGTSYYYTLGMKYALSEKLSAFLDIQSSFKKNKFKEFDNMTFINEKIPTWTVGVTRHF